MVKTYVLSRSVDYEGTRVLGVFSNFSKANEVRSDIIKENYNGEIPDNEYFDNDDYSTLRIDDICFTIETFEINIKKRDF